MSALAGALAVAGIHRLRSIDRQRVRFVFPPPTWVAQLAIKMVSDSAKLIAALSGAAIGRAVEGRLQAVPFDAGRKAGRCAARRTWVTLGRSLPPNGIVIFVDRRRQRLLQHELVPTQTTDEPQEWPT